MPYNRRGTFSKADIDNKSCLSYRPGISVPGTTKHIPGFASIPVTIKTAVNQRDGGKVIKKEHAEKISNSEAQPTTYGQTHILDPNHDYSIDPRQGGGYWAAANIQVPASIADPKPFVSKTTYQCEISDAAGKPVASLQTAVEASSQRPSIKPGYLTQYTGASLPVQQKFCNSNRATTVGREATSSSITQVASPSKAGSSSRGANSLAHASTAPPHFDGCTTYNSMYTAGITDATETLNIGTPKSSLHVPGYGGHVPSTKELALAARGASHGRREDVQLYHLDQHSRGLTPGYTGHRPAHKERVTLQPPPPTKATTQGAAQQETLQWAEYNPPSAALNSRTGTLSFFSSGGGGAAFVSENGQAEAAMYHQIARPYEGRMRIPHASATNKLGAKFTS